MQVGCVCNLSVATDPTIPSCLFWIVISPPIASAALLAKNNPSPAPCSFPILLKGAGKLGTGSISAGSATLNTTGSFFTSDMLASDSAGDGGLYQKIRIPGAGPLGSELEAEILKLIEDKFNEVNMEEI